MSPYRSQVPRVLLAPAKPTWEDWVDFGFKALAAAYGIGVCGAIIVFCIVQIVHDLFFR